MDTLNLIIAGNFDLLNHSHVQALIFAISQATGIQASDVILDSSCGAGQCGSTSDVRRRSLDEEESGKPGRLLLASTSQDVVLRIFSNETINITSALANIQLNASIIASVLSTSVGTLVSVQAQVLATVSKNVGWQYTVDASGQSMLVGW